MRVFISYSHADNAMLQLLHKHLAQLQRDETIAAWTDQEIPAGGVIDAHINQALQRSNLFLALLSPDYIASNYCYTKEFKWALRQQEQEQIIIVPIILEPCDWLNTPFSAFKALPKDGKAVSSWENRNTAFLDAVQNLRYLVQQSAFTEMAPNQKTGASTPVMTKNYRVQKDFDSIEKIEFLERTFHDLREYLKRYMEEIIQLENIKVRILIDTKDVFDCLLVNRNKIATESQLKISTERDNSSVKLMRADEGRILYNISKANRTNNGFSLAADEYRLFWHQGLSYSRQGKQQELSPREMADVIWNEWLGSVGII